MDNEYERTLILKELCQHVENWEKEIQQAMPVEKSEIERDIRWHKEMLQNYR